MAKKVLSVKEIARITKDGIYAVGGVTGLCLRVRGGSRTWILRYTAKGRRSIAAIGNCETMTLADARKTAIGLRSKVEQGVHLGEEKIEALAAAERARKAEEEERVRATLTFEKVAEMWIEDRAKHGGFSKNPRGESVTRNTLKIHAYPVIGKMRVDAVTEKDMFEVLRPLWTTTVSTHKRVLSLSAEVFRWAAAMGLRGSNNPASLEGPLRVFLDQLGVHKTQGQTLPSLDWRELPDFMVAIHETDTILARLLEFSILTASRIKPARLATWSQINLEEGTWDCPEVSMKVKGRGNFRVILSPQAVDLLRSLPRMNEWVFPGSRWGKPMSEDMVSKLIEKLHNENVAKGGDGWIDRGKSVTEGKPIRVTQHGTARATFFTFFRSEDRMRLFDRDALELCLAHKVGGKTDQSYDHAKMDAERRRIMSEWGRWCWSRMPPRA